MLTDASTAADADTIAGAVNDAQLIAATREVYRGESEPPHVDFEKQIVVVFNYNVPGDCPEVRLARLVFDELESTVYGVTDAPPQHGCSDMSGTHSFVVAIDRVVLPRGEVTFRLEREYRRCADCERNLEQVTLLL